MKKIFIILALTLILISCEKKNSTTEKSFLGSITQNTPVAKQLFMITPEKPHINDTLNIALPAAIKLNNIEWYVNNNLVEESKTLQNQFKKGDYITAVVIYKDHDGKQKEITTPPVNILDSPPVIKSVVIMPSSPAISTTLTASIEASDPDMDTLTYRITWYVNDKIIDGATGDTFSCASYKQGDAIHAVVTPFDGEMYGTSVSSNVVFIQDTPPLITSLPPTTTTGSLFIYKIQTFDPNQNKLTYKLEESPPGMVVNNSGEIIWDTKDFKKSGVVPVKIVVSDGFGGAVAQKFSITIIK